MIPYILLTTLVGLWTPDGSLFDVGLALIALLGAVSTVGAIPVERANQSFEVLLTTPIPAAGIVQQKMAARRRLLAWLTGLFLCEAGLRWLLAANGWTALQTEADDDSVRIFLHTTNWHLRGLVELAAAYLAPQAGAWTGMLAGVLSASIPQALIRLAVAVILVLVVMPVVVAVCGASDDLRFTLQLLSPLNALLDVQAGLGHMDGPLSALLYCAIILALWFAGVWLLRRLCLFLAGSRLAGAAAS